MEMNVSQNFLRKAREMCTVSGMVHSHSCACCIQNIIIEIIEIAFAQLDRLASQSI